MKILISVLSGDIWDDNGVWRTKDTDYHLDADAARTDSFRLAAAAALARDRSATLLLHGGLAGSGRPSLASVMSRELRLSGVPDESIMLEEKTETSYQQLLAFQEMAKKHRPPALSVVSNEWHLPRIKAMLEYAPALSFLRARNPALIAAEAVLLDTDAARWRDRIEEVRQSPGMHAREMLEQKGVEDLKAGLYHFR